MTWEWTIPWGNRVIAGFLTCREDILIEGHIARHNEGVLRWIPENVPLGPSSITNKRHLECLLLEFVTVVLLHMYKGFTAKYPEV